MKDLSLYIHIPFCIQKCYYCDFLSFTMDEETVDLYFENLVKEIEGYGSMVNEDTVVRTIFIGGGTPTCVDSKYILQILKVIRTRFVVDPHVEISIESNPATFDVTKLLDYKKAGINRLSMGLQCWQDDLLKSIGRIHTQEEFVRSFLEAKAVGFENINVDLIFGLPNQTMDNWKETLQEVCKLEPSHLSCYSLKLEKGTELYRRAQVNQFVLDEELDRQMYHYTLDTLYDKGYLQYEISNFSKPDMECKHNLVYWELGDYIGFGLGAHSYFNGFRYNNEEKIKSYISHLQQNKAIVKDKNLVSREHIKEEFIFLGLRKTKGIDGVTYEKLFHQNIFEDFKDEIEKLDDYIIVDGGNIRLSKKGLDFANYVFMNFLK